MFVSDDPCLTVKTNLSQIWDLFQEFTLNPGKVTKLLKSMPEVIKNNKKSKGE